MKVKQEYFYIDSYGIVCSSYWRNDEIDIENNKNNNIFLTMDEAKKDPRCKEGMETE